jgi:SWI/SNF-related matrix-associated actin-dependent regulator of chromatin subfamily A3
MGLGKKLTTLMFILATRELARQSLTTLPNLEVQRSIATLIICPLTTLSNWKKEMEVRFAEGTFSYCIFHGRDRSKISIEQLVSSMVVLTTYKMIGTGSGEEGSRMIDSLNVHWFRIVLDEAQ